MSYVYDDVTYVYDDVTQDATIVVHVVDGLSL